jgi:cell cycle checkpoint protein
MPQLIAVSSTARDLFLLLKCIGFAPKALVQLSKHGLRFTVEEVRVMQGLYVRPA